MNQETFDQHSYRPRLDQRCGLPAGRNELWMLYPTPLPRQFCTLTCLMKVQMKITYTEPGLKGDTATNTLKPATVESGATVRVPLFINEGETIEIDTRDGSYVGRVKA